MKKTVLSLFALLALAAAPAVVPAASASGPSTTPGASASGPAVVPASPATTPAASASGLNSGWTALVVGRDSAALPVDLPHNFDDYYGYRQLRHGNLHGTALYHKVFTADKRPAKRYFLQFEGVGTYATVTLNGREYPRELVGRTVWTLDVTDALRSGDNDLRVRVDHPAMQTASPWVCGGCSSEYGFSEGSQPFGIFRPVTLVETDEVRIEPFGVHIWANADCDSLFIETEVRNYAAAPQSVELVSTFEHADGAPVFRLDAVLTLAPGETRTVRQSSPIAAPRRWSLDDPYLYTLVSTLNGQPLPAVPASSAALASPSSPASLSSPVRTPFGIRSISWPLHRPATTPAASASGPATTPAASASGPATTPAASASGDNRFRLNGLPVFINGTCEYEHILGSSHAFTPEQIRSRIKQIRNAGFNALREAHQPHNLLYQQLCDQQGLLFWSQFSAHIWYDTPEFRQNFLRLLERWVRERRNSPSVILWGLQNESVLPRDFAEQCTALIRRLDPTASVQRPVTTCNGGEGTDWNVVQNWSGTYGGSAEAYADELARPDQLLNGEYGAWRTLDLHGPAPYSEESFTALLALKDSLARQAFAAPAAPVPAASAASVSSTFPATLGVCGHFQWLFASHDNPGRVQPDGALRRIDRVGPVNYKGLVTIWEEPTPAYYMYRRRHAAASVSTSASASVSISASASAPAATTPGASASGSAACPSALLAPAPGYRYLYRINCGGDALLDAHGHLWQADDSLLSHSWAQDFPGIPAYQASQRHITAPIRGTATPALFQSFRFGRHRLWYDIPLPAPSEPSGPSGQSGNSGNSGYSSPSGNSALYRIDLYFLEPWHGRDDRRDDRPAATAPADYAGLRIFDVAVNDSLVIDDLDPWAEAGYCAPIKRTVYAPDKDGRLRISFPEVKAGQAVIAAIAVATPETSVEPVAVSQRQTEQGTQRQTAPDFWLALDADTIAKLPASELPVDLEPRPATVYEPLPPGKRAKATTPAASASGTTTFVITPGLGQEYALRFRYKNTTDAPVTARLTLTDAKGIILVDRPLSFPPTPPKGKMLSTTTGTQINAGTYHLTIQADGLEFKNLEIQ